ncbi:hypothetical protein HDU91_007506 [Kappamyces sp. JEL0680]|nr:hypothetical protein HDU91_007506 [Kappamyces sp. JEL0680]
MDELYDARHGFEATDSTDRDQDTDWFQDQVFNLPSELEQDQDISQPRWMLAQQRARERQLALDESLEQATDADGTGPLSIKEIVAELTDHAAMNINVIDTRSRVDHMDAVIICEGRSAKHVYTLADSIRILAKNRYFPGAYMPPNLAVEGTDVEDWLVLDLGRYMVHCFTPQGRADIDLDGVWAEPASEPGRSYHNGSTTQENLRNTADKHLKGIRKPALKM